VKPVTLMSDPLPIETEMYAVLSDLGVTLGSMECAALARWLKHRDELAYERGKAVSETKPK
jgi:hypothetical protein